MRTAVLLGWGPILMSLFTLNCSSENLFPRSVTQRSWASPCKLGAELLLRPHPLSLGLRVGMGRVWLERKLNGLPSMLMRADAPSLRSEDGTRCRRNRGVSGHRKDHGTIKCSNQACTGFPNGKSAFVAQEGVCGTGNTRCLRGAGQPTVPTAVRKRELGDS